MVEPLLGVAGMSDDNIIHFNPWRDFNDAAPQQDAFGTEPDRAQITTFLDVVFGYCEGFVPVRGYVDRGQGIDGKPHNVWIAADATVADKMVTFAAWAAREGAAVYVIPGTVAESGQAKAADVRQMQTIVVDLDAGDIGAKLDHLVEHLGDPTLVVESGGRTAEGATKLHVVEAQRTRRGRTSQRSVVCAATSPSRSAATPFPLGASADPRGRQCLSQGRLPAAGSDPPLPCTCRGRSRRVC
jgi:hypothetical protein